MLDSDVSVWFPCVLFLIIIIRHSRTYAHSPIGNPLHFDQPDLDPYGINHGRYHELCDGSDWRDVTLRQVAQRRQEDFYAAWVGEMIRIAKPGKPVIVEHVSQPKCEDRADWGTSCQTNMIVFARKWIFVVVTGVSSEAILTRLIVLIVPMTQVVWQNHGGTRPLGDTTGRLTQIPSLWKMIIYIPSSGITFS